MKTKYRAAMLSSIAVLGLLQLHFRQLRSATMASPGWLRDGIVASSDMEALTFVLRRGGGPDTAIDQWRENRTEEAVRKLKAEGVNFAITNLHKGAGLRAESQDMESARAFTALAHKYGIRVAGYVGATMMYETFFQEVPEAKNWRQVNEFGDPIYYTADQTFRYLACRNNPEYRAFIKKVIRIGIEDLKLDSIHFDQMQWWPEPNSCRCAYCRAQFIEFLGKRYPDPQKARLRFGFGDFREVIPPPYGLHEPPVRLPELHNPMMQERSEFSAWSLARDFQEFTDYIHQLNPNAAMIANPTMSPETNVGFIYGVDPEKLFPTADAIWTEEPNSPQWTSDDRLVSQIRSYKTARSLGKPLFHWQDLDGYERYRETPATVRLAESLAYDDANLGVIAGRDVGQPSAAARRYVKFFQANLGDLVNTEEVADAAILRSFPSVQFNPSVSSFNTLLFEQTLIQSKIPFGIVFDKQMTDLHKYKVLVLADQDALSDGQIQVIRQFVEDGGGLVSTGTTSMLTEWRTKRNRFALADLFGISAPPADGASNAPVQRTFGKGRVAYIPRIEAEVPAPPPQMNYAVRNAYWKLPKNYRQLADAVRWAAGGPLSASVEAPLWVTNEVAEQPSSHTRLLHLVNFKDKEPLRDIPVLMQVPEGMRLREVMLKSPDEPAAIPLKFTLAGNVAALRVPRLAIYDLILFRMEAK